MTTGASAARELARARHLHRCTDARKHRAYRAKLEAQSAKHGARAMSREALQSVVRTPLAR